MGEPKQLLRYAGETLLRRAVKAAVEAACRPVVVVLGARAEELRAEAEWGGALVVINEAWAEGMGSSLRSGIGALVASADGAEAKAAVVMLCDQPLVTSAVVARLVDAYRMGGARLVASEYGAGDARTHGVPALFDRSLFPELMRLRGLEGAKGVIARHTAAASFIPVDAAAFDVDTPDDYQRLEGRR